MYYRSEMVVLVLILPVKTKNSMFRRRKMLKYSCLIVFLLLQSSGISILKTTGQSVVTLCVRTTGICTVFRVVTSLGLLKLRLMLARSGQMALLEPLPTGVKCVSSLHRIRESYGSYQRLEKDHTRVSNLHYVVG